MNSKFCPNCGFKLEESFKVCPNCGFKLSKIESKKKDDIFNDDLNENDQIEQGFDKLLNKELAKKQAYDDSLKEALTFINANKYKEAELIYQKLIDENISNMQAQIGLIRVSSKNFTEFYDNLDKDLDALKVIYPIQDFTKKDEDFNNYYKQYLDMKFKLSRANVIVPINAIVTFGSYITKKNNKHPIEWEIIENDGKYATLRPLYVLDQVNLSNNSINALDSYLNNDFIEKFFSDEERRNIKIINDKAATIFTENELFSFINYDRCSLKNENISINASSILCSNPLNQKDSKNNILLSYDFNGNRKLLTGSNNQYAIYPKITVKQSYIALVYDEKKILTHKAHNFEKGDNILFGRTNQNKQLIWNVLKVKKYQLILALANFDDWKDISDTYILNQDSNVKLNFEFQKDFTDKVLNDIYNSIFNKHEKDKLLLNPDNGKYICLPSKEILQNNNFKKLIINQNVKFWVDYPSTLNNKQYLTYVNVSNQEIKECVADDNCKNMFVPIICIKSKENYTEEELNTIKQNQDKITKFFKKVELEKIKQREIEEEIRKQEELNKKNEAQFIEEYKMFIYSKENNIVTILDLQKEFKDIKNLDLVIPSSCSVLKNDIFKNSKNIRSITSNSKNLTIGSSAFENSSITKFVNNGKIDAIQTSAFENSSISKFINKGKGYIKTIGKCAFKNCKNLTELKIEVIEIQDYAFMNSSLNKLEISSVKNTCISYGKFIIQGTNIEVLNLDNSIESIEYGAFYSEKLKEINSKGNIYKSVDGVLYHLYNQSYLIKYYELLTYPAGKDNSHFDLPNKIDNYAITKIAPLAFYRANKLTSFSENGDYYITICKEAFKECNNLQTVKIPYFIQIEARAFENCKSLKYTGLDNVKCYSNKEIKIEDEAYLGCDNINPVYVFYKIDMTEKAFSKPNILKRKYFLQCVPGFLNSIINLFTKK